MIVLRFAAALSLVGLVTLLAVAAEEVSDLRPEQAVELYDRGRYREAREILEQLDAEGTASGALLYRLSFCRRATGDPVGEEEARRRAIEALEVENRTATGLEVPFYLANAYLNDGRGSEAREVARAATAKVEAGGIPEPSQAMEMFRLAKLYADQNAEEQASRWYERSLEGFAKLGEAYPGNVAWARRYLAERAYARVAYADAERHYAALAELPGVSATDLERLAVARVRLGDYGGAHDAWQRVERMNPAEANHARYARHLARLADSIGTLPETAPSGESWSRLDRAGLEAVMATQVDLARETIASAAGVDPARRAELQAAVDAAEAAFVRAGLEYAVRNYPIRETAFSGGYAPMIFHADRWKLPGGAQ